MKRKLAIAGGVVVVLVVLATWLKMRGDDRSSSPAGAKSSTATGGSAASGAGRTRAQREKAAPATVSGRVTRKSDGAPIPKAVVTLTSTDLGEMFQSADKPPLIAVTDANGHWHAARIPVGTYVATAQGPGFLPQRRDDRLVLGDGEQRTGLDFVLDAGGTVVSGSVTDVGGGPIDGARVVFKRSNAIRPEEANVVTAMVGADGRYSITLGDGSFEGEASHDDYTTVERDFELAGKPFDLDFVLTPGGAIRGRVVTRADGKPVPGAHVEAELERMGAKDRDAFADANGTFVVRSLAPGPVSLTARARGYKSTAPVVVHLGIGEQVEDIVIVVDKALSISGRIREAGKQKGIPGVMVGAFSIAAREQATSLEPSADDGSYEIVGVKPASYLLFAFGEGFMPEIGKQVEVVDRDVTDADIELAAGVTLSGRVEPPVAASISLEMPPGSIGIGNMFEAIKVMIVHGESTASGTFALRNVPNGSFVLLAKPPDGRVGKLPVVVAGQDQQGLIVKLEPRAAISGRVVDARGVAVAGVRVKVAPVRDEDVSSMFNMGPNSRDDAISGPDGAFRVVGLDAGKIDITVSDDQGRLAWATPANKDKPREPMRLELAAGVERSGVTLAVEARDGVIRGVVLGPDRKPAVDAWVTARVIDPAKKPGDTDYESIMAEWDASASRPVLTNLEGRFAIDRLRRGTYKLVVEGDKGRARAEKTDVKTGETVTIQLASLGTLSGRVTLGSTPVRVFDLECEGDGMRWGSTHRRIDNPDGAYTLERLVPGKYECTVSSDAGTAKGSVEVPAGTAKLDFALVPWATITGVVVSVLSGEPVPGVHVVSEGGTWNMDKILTGQTPGTDARGRFIVEQIAAGSGKLMIMGAKGSFDQLATKDYTVTAGQRLDVGTIKIVPPRTGELGTFGLSTKAEDNKLEVTFVKEGGPAAGAGVQPGDKIVALEGKPVAELTAELASKLLSSGTVAVGQTVTLTLDRGGAPLQVKLVAIKWE